MTIPATWRLRPQGELNPELLAVVGGHPLVARLLAQRGLGDPARARAFLDPASYTPSSPWDLPGMEAACAAVRQAVAQGERVRVWGDLDADGQTATTVLVEALQALGAQVDFALPLRQEGHGLSVAAVQAAHQAGATLLITCDTGVTDIEAVQAARALGLAVVITDHHDLGPALPAAQAIVNPKMLPTEHPLHELAGVGVAYLLARALLEGGTQQQRLTALLDLVAIGLIADISAQMGEVHYLCQIGLAQLRRTQRPGLRALCEAAHVDLATIGEQEVGYQLGPRLNAAGRLADAARVVRLLLTSDPGEAQALAGELEALNLDRRARTEAVTRQIEERLATDPELARHPAIVLDSDSWEPGVLGLVAGDLARRYGRPTLLIGRRADGVCVGSARSVEGVDIHEAIAAQGSLLVREGGHPMAAGFTLLAEHVPAFRQAVWAHVAARTSAERLTPLLELDALVPAAELGLGLAHELARLAPHGPGNPRPALLLAGATCVRNEELGRTEGTPHRRLILSVGGELLRLIWFNAGALPLADEVIDVALQLGIDRWRGKESAALFVLAWRPASVELSAIPALAQGREIVDWRTRPDAEPLLAHLRAAYGERLALWAEGLAHPPQGVQSRVDLGEARTALAILTPPPSLEVLGQVLARAQPALVYVLPLRQRELDQPGAFLALVAGMLQTALSARGGALDMERMAARAATTTEAVRTALLGLAAAGQVRLFAREGQWLARPSGASGAPLDEGWVELVPPPVAQARHEVAFALREIVAFRRAFSQEPLDGLLRGA